MSHLDEGTLHALLDGELDLTEVSEIQLHLGSCVACGSRLQEVKQVLAEADRLVGAVEMPAGASNPRPQLPIPSSPRAAREPEISDETPVLLLPESPDAFARRERAIRGLRWVAIIALVVGGGRVISNSLHPDRPMLPERDLTSASPAVPPAVVSPEERPGAESKLAPVRGKPARPAAHAPATAPKSTVRSGALAAARPVDSAADFADKTAPSSEDSIAADSSLAAQAAADSTTELAAAAAPDKAKDSGAAVQKARKTTADEPRQDEIDVQRAAAAALAELDRERRRERANAATAALPPARQEVTPAAESAPAPRTLEQRAQVYLRIGLDEAANQLGRPVHVIEGMTPQFIGLTRQVVPGADSSRPVVRVVYLDARGRMILLDQQRIPAGRAPAASGNLRWTVGDVMLYLRGEPSVDVLRGLQGRVR